MTNLKEIKYENCVFSCFLKCSIVYFHRFAFVSCLCEISFRKGAVSLTQKNCLSLLCLCLFVDIVMTVYTNFKKTKYVNILHSNKLEKVMLKQDINHPGAELNCMCNTMNNINCNLESHELQFCEWHT